MNAFRASRLLELTADMLARDRGIHDRLVRHYTMWKCVVDDPSHPDQEKLRAVREDTELSSRPVRRSEPKVGPNDSRPYGSGRTFKKCCRAWASDAAIDSVREQILLSTANIDDAYARYALTANRTGTYVGWFRAIAKKYPHKPAATILADLVRLTPGDQGKWFAAAKEAKLFDEALALAKRTPCDPRTLTRAARDFAERNPTFATEAGMVALYWLIRGHGYEVTSADVWAACSNTMRAARNAGRADEGRNRIQALVRDAQPRSDVIAEIIGHWSAQDPQ